MLLRDGSRDGGERHQPAIKDKQKIPYPMSKSNIGEPFLLATYTSTIRGIHLLRKPGVYATVSQKSSSDDHVTVAVQADGVHILDVSYFIEKKSRAAP